MTPIEQALRTALEQIARLQAGADARPIAAETLKKLAQHEAEAANAARSTGGLPVVFKDVGPEHEMELALEVSRDGVQVQLWDSGRKLYDHFHPAPVLSSDDGEGAYAIHPPALPKYMPSMPFSSPEDLWDHAVLTGWRAAQEDDLRIGVSVEPEGTYVQVWGGELKLYGQFHEMPGSAAGPAAAPTWSADEVADFLGTSGKVEEARVSLIARVVGMALRHTNPNEALLFQIERLQALLPEPHRVHVQRHLAWHKAGRPHVEVRPLVPSNG